RAHQHRAAAHGVHRAVGERVAARFVAFQPRGLLVRAGQVRRPFAVGGVDLPAEVEVDRHAYRPGFVLSEVAGAGRDERPVPGGLGRSRPQAIAETVHLPFAGVDAEVDPLDHDVLDRALPSDLEHEIRRALPTGADHVPGIARRLHLQALDVVRGPPAVEAEAGAGDGDFELVLPRRPGQHAQGHRRLRRHRLAAGQYGLEAPL